MTVQRREQLVGQVPISYLYDEATADGANAAAPVLFLHGWGGSAESFLELWKQWRENDTLDTQERYALDFPGFGETPPPPSAWSVYDYATCVVQYMDALDIDKAHLVVHSFGGRVATILANEHPNRIASITYIAPAGIRHPRKGLSAIAAVTKKILLALGLRRLFELVRSVGYRATGGHDYLKVDGVMKETFKQVTAEDLQHLLEGVACPVEIFWGTQDTYVPVKDAQQMKSAMPQAHLHIFKDGRHGIHKTHAAQIADILEKSSLYTRGTNA